MVGSNEPRPPSPRPPAPPAEGGTNFWDADKEKDYLAIPTTPPPAQPPFSTPAPNVASTPPPKEEHKPTLGPLATDIKEKAHPPIMKPGQKLLCVDSKSIVIMTNSILLVSSIVHLTWNLITDKRILAAFSGGTILMCFVIIFNIFLTKSAACYVISATSLAIILLANYGFIGYKYYERNSEAELKSLQLPAFEGFVIGFIVVLGLIQLYRLQVFNDALRFAERNSIRRLKNSLGAMGRSLRGIKPGFIEP